MLETCTYPIVSDSRENYVLGVHLATVRAKKPKTCESCHPSTSLDLNFRLVVVVIPL